MNRYFEEHDQRKQQVIDYLKKAENALNLWNQTESAEAVTHLRENVENGLFGIVLVGEFSAGKSTFLNALMQRRILPSYTSETTATVNFLRHISESPNGEAGVVYYRDGHTEVLPDQELSTIQNAVSTSGENVAQAVDHVDLFLDCELLKDGVMLVDSPGLNGVADGHREITENQIKRSHASIFMFSADHPGSKTDFDYLHELKQQSDNIFFVLNKIDVVRDDEGQTVEDVIDELKNSYHKCFPDEVELPKIWPVSASMALAAREKNILSQNGSTPSSDALEKSRMQDFENRLWQYLTKGERTRDQLYSPVRSVVKEIDSQRKQFKRKVDLLQAQTSSEELEKQKELLEAQIRELGNARKPVSSSVRRNADTAIRNMEESIDADADRLLEKIKRKLEEKKSVEELMDYAERLPKELQRMYGSMAKKMNNDLRRELLNAILEAYGEDFEELYDKIEGYDQGSQIQLEKLELNLENVAQPVDLKSFDEQCDELNKQIEALRESIDVNTARKMKARRVEREISETQNQIAALRNAKNVFEDTFLLPTVDYRQEEYTEYVKRGGFLGFFGNILFGDKPERRTRLVEDATAREEEKAKRDRRIQSQEQEIQELQDCMKNLQVPEISSEEYEVQIAQSEHRLSRLETDLIEIQEKFRKTLEHNAETACRRLRRDVAYKVRDYNDEGIGKVKDYLNHQRQQYILLVKETVNAKLHSQLQEAQAKLDELIKTIQTEGEDRKRQLEEAESNYQMAKELSKIGSELETELESVLTDKVETEALVR